MGFEVDSPGRDRDNASIALFRRLVQRSWKLVVLGCCGLLGIAMMRSLHLVPSDLLSFDSAQLYDEPPESCEYCLLNPANDLCQYGLDGVRQSKEYVGSGHRMRRFFQRLLDGQRVTVAVIGGSITNGHGVFVYYGELIWYQYPMKRLEELFPGQIEFIEASRPAMDSQFYTWCLRTVTKAKRVDLYIGELDVNNPWGYDSFFWDDALTRAILAQPHAPALIRVTAFAISFSNLINGASSTHLTSQYFDVPVIGIRNTILPHVVNQPDLAKKFFSRNWYGDDAPKDFRHMSNVSHKALGEALTIYLEETLCDLKRRNKMKLPEPKRPWPQLKELDQIPRLPLTKPYSFTYQMPPVEPLCLLPDSEEFPLEPASTRGKWEMMEWNDKKALASTDEDASVTFKIKGTHVAIMFWETKNVMLSDGVMSGSIACRLLEDHPDEEILIEMHDPLREAAGSAVAEVARDLPFGEYTLVCDKMPMRTKSEFRILSVIAH